MGLRQVQSPEPLLSIGEMGVDSDRTLFSLHFYYSTGRCCPVGAGGLHDPPHPPGCGLPAVHPSVFLGPTRTFIIFRFSNVNRSSLDLMELAAASLF